MVMLLEGLEVAEIAQDTDGVTVIAKDTDTGQKREFRCKYLIGADGAHSRVRDLLSIEFDGRGVFSARTRRLGESSCLGRRFPMDQTCARITAVSAFHCVIATLSASTLPGKPAPARWAEAC